MSLHQNFLQQLHRLLISCNQVLFTVFKACHGLATQYAIKLICYAVVCSQDLCCQVINCYRVLIVCYMGSRCHKVSCSHFSKLKFIGLSLLSLLLLYSHQFMQVFFFNFSFWLFLVMVFCCYTLQMSLGLWKALYKSNVVFKLLVYKWKQFHLSAID